MKKPRIVFPVLAFSLFCAITALSGALAGFFCVLVLGGDAPQNVQAQAGGGADIRAFLENKTRGRHKFPPSSFRAAAEKILYEDFLEKGVSSAEILAAPEFEAGQGALLVKVRVNSPVAFFKIARTIVFEFGAENGVLRLKGARLGAARVPRFAAKIAFGRMLSSYLQCRRLKICAENFRDCRAEIEGGFLVLER